MSLRERKTRGEDEGAAVIICTGFTAAGNIKRPPQEMNSLPRRAV